MVSAIPTKVNLTLEVLEGQINLHFTSLPM